jgi:hypothetical protein
MLMKTTLSPLDTYGLQSKAELARLARQLFNVKGSLLADPLSNPKVAKNAEENGVLTFPLHLAPADMSGYNTCAAASAGCKAACLNTAGNPAYMVGKMAARTAKTIMYFENRPLFVAILIKEVVAARNKAVKQNMAMAIRFNATSDIKIEKVKLNHVGLDLTIIELLHSAAPLAKFYDYAKEHKRTRDTLPAYYSLTYSLSEANEVSSGKVLARGDNLAVVFDTKRGQPLPAMYTIGGVTKPVIDGELTDYRPDDVQGCIVGLRAKGDAKGDTSGFVRPAHQTTFLTSRG